MLKISDILKKVQKAKSKVTRSVSKAEKPESSESVSVQNKPVIKKRTKKKIPTDEQSASEKDLFIPPQSGFKNKTELKDAIESYSQAIVAVKKLLSPLVDNSTAVMEKTEKLVDAFIGMIETDDTLLVRLFFRDYESMNDYIYQHSVNVCIMALVLGVTQGYDRNNLRKLGLAAMIHDIGMIKFSKIINQPRKLELAEYDKVKQHPDVGRELLKKFAKNIDLKIFDIIHQEHERVDGSGYPHGLKDDMIDVAAKIIGLADVYEALVHARPYRFKLSSRDAVETVIQEKAAFDYKLLKKLIDSVGIFPVGTLVELNTRETGVVLVQNQAMPLRPVVEITHNSDRQKISKAKSIDLSENFSIYIKNCLNESQ